MLQYIKYLRFSVDGKGCKPAILLIEMEFRVYRSREFFDSYMLMGEYMYKYIKFINGRSDDSSTKVFSILLCCLDLAFRQWKVESQIDGVLPQKRPVIFYLDLSW